MSKSSQRSTAENERVKFRYLTYLAQAHRRGITTVDMAAAAIADFEESVGRKNFKFFRPAWAIKYKENLEMLPSLRTGKLLAPSTIVTKLGHIQKFFMWLSDQEGYRSRVRRSDVDYFNTSLRLNEAAQSRNNRRAPSIEQVLHVVRTMPATTEVERCVRAVISFAFLSGGRADAVASMRLGNIDFDDKTVFFDGRATRTKGRKSYTAAFFPVDDELIRFVRDWAIYLRRERLFGPDDPLFPMAEMKHGSDRLYEATGRVTRQTWKSSEPIRRHFRQACEAAGVPYFNPHSVRTTLGQLGLKICRNPEELKAFSQNLGHTSIDTTLLYYARLNDDRQSQLMQNIAKRSNRRGIAAPK